MNKILWAANTYWDSPFQVGANHLARQLVKLGWGVSFVSDPISPLHFFKPHSRTGVYDRFYTWLSGGKYDLNGKLFYYTPLTLFPPQNFVILRNKWILYNWHKYTIPNIIRKIHDIGFLNVNVCVIDTITQGFWLNYIKAKKTIYRVTDNFSGFKKATPEMLEREKAIARKVDLVVYTAASLKSYVEELTPRKMKYIPNGVNITHFLSGSKEKPIEYKNISSPIAIYVGAIDYWFDYDSLNYAIDSLKNVNFVIIGPPDNAKKYLIPKSNLHILGIKKYDELSQYLYNADVGIIPFNVRDYSRLVNNVNPIKLYEYMACNLPVVSAAWDELRVINSPAKLYNSKEQFVSLILQELRIKRSYDLETRINFARNADWSNRVQLFLDILN